MAQTPVLVTGATGFVGRWVVADLVRRGVEQALSHARAVLGTIAGFVSEGEIRDLRSQLPAGYAPLFEEAHK